MNMLMVTQVKRYDVLFKGNVQDVGFRDYVIALANISKLNGYIFNDRDGTVKMIVEGVRDTVNSFLNELKSRKYITGTEIESLQQRELSDNFYLPDKFVKLSTDEMYDIDRKLGIGNELLANIKNNTNNIQKGIDSLNTKFDSFLEKQTEFTNNIIEHNSRLEKILEKLIEK